MEGRQSWATSPASRKVMQANKPRDTSPELKVRRALHAGGLRYRVAYRPEPALRRSADIVFTRQRIAIFIDGCYWHACPQHGTKSRSNAAYWSEKLAQNVARDADTTQQLRSRGWTVLRFWEHEDPRQVAATVIEAVRSTRTEGEAAPRGGQPRDLPDR
jgi:DNA mismatch endonuclease (patch repair protein)